MLNPSAMYYNYNGGPNFSNLAQVPILAPPENSTQAIIQAVAALPPPPPPPEVERGSTTNFKKRSKPIKEKSVEV